MRDVKGSEVSADPSRGRVLRREDLESEKVRFLRGMGGSGRTVNLVSETQCLSTAAQTSVGL